MSYESVKERIVKHISNFKQVAITIVSMLVFFALLYTTLVPLFAFVHRPQHPVIQRNLDQYHRWINYGDTVPNIDRMSGIASATPVGEGGDGWINSLRFQPNHIYNPKFIVDYNKCLSRALYTNNRGPGFHSRLSLCPYPPYNRRISAYSTPAEQITVDVRKFGTNDRGDMKSSDRGIALTWNEYISLVKMFKWVEAYYLEHRNYDFSINTTSPGVQPNLRKLGNDTEEFGIDVLYGGLLNKTTTTTQPTSTTSTSTTRPTLRFRFGESEDDASTTEIPAWAEIWRFLNRTADATE